ncbi:hypothetical protein Tco_1293182 [Tanacetum coccineum]
MEKNSPKPSSQSPPLENFLKGRVQGRSSTWTILWTQCRTLCFKSSYRLDTLAPDHEISSEPTVSPHCDDGIDFDFKISFDETDDEDYIVNYDKNSFSYKLTFVNDLKPNADKEKVEINISSDDIIVEPSDGIIDVKIDTHFHEFDENREASHDIPGKYSALKDFVIMIKVMIQMHYYEGMSLIFIIKNLYMQFGIPFDPKMFYKDGDYMISYEGQGYGRLSFAYMAPLPPRYQRHLWLRYEGQEYTNVVVHDYKGRLGMIFGKQVNRVHVLDFEGLIDEITQALTDKLRMVHTGAKGQVLFTSDAWRQVFEIKGTLVLELMLEFFSTCRISNTMLKLDVEMATDGFKAYWTDNLREISSKANFYNYGSRIAFDGDFLGVVPSYTSIRGPLRRLCHRLIAFNISGRGQAPKKVNATD